jgi:hypothetical protein
MKIIEDKVTVYPPHALCRKDIQLILTVVPPSWTKPLRAVRLSAMLQCADVAHFNNRTRTLNIISRGHTKEHVISETLLELASIAQGGSTGKVRDEARIKSIVSPLAEQIMPKLSVKKIWLEK